MTYTIRAWLCEIFVSWAMKVAPPGYVPSYIEVAIDYYNRGRLGK